MSLKIVLFLFFTSKFIFAQDLIITKDSVRIICQIIKIDSTKIYFQKYKNKSLINDSIKIAQISNYYLKSKLSNSTKELKDTTTENSQANFKYAIHITNPVGMFQKAGIKIELRQKTIGLLFSVIHYYGQIPRCPGTQFQFEIRNYNTKTNPLFFYFKAFGGHEQFVEDTRDGWGGHPGMSPGNYYGLGIGGGKRFNYNHFFIDLNGGLKYAISNVGQVKAFYTVGPASYFDLHCCFGLQF